MRRDDGVVGLVPMTSLELIAEVQKNGEMTQVQNLGAGYASADSASKKAPGAHPGEKDRTWVMPENEWNVGCCGRIRKILGEQVLYNEWSKWAQLFAAYVVIFEGVAMVVWDINENSRLTGVTDNNTMPWEYSYCGYENLAPDAVVIPDCCEPGGQRSPATTVRLRHCLASCANFLLKKHRHFRTRTECKSRTSTSTASTRWACRTSSSASSPSGSTPTVARPFSAHFTPFRRRSFAFFGFLAPRRRGERAKNGVKWAKSGGETAEKWLSGVGDRSGCRTSSLASSPSPSTSSSSPSNAPAGTKFGLKIDHILGIFCDILGIFEDTLGRAPADAKWPDKMKAEGPPKILRALVNIVVAGLLMLQPSPGKLAGSCVSAVALLSIGAVSTTGLQTIFTLTWNVMDEYSHGVVLQVLRGKADRSVMYTIEQNPVPLLSFFRSLCRKSDGK